MSLELWKQVDITDPTHTKEVTLGRKFTAIDAHYQVMRATEVFGPCGQGWGIRNSQYQVLALDAQNAHYSLLQFTAQLWYIWDGKEGQLDIAADIELFNDTRNGWKRVEDSHKKVRTDAVTKGLSWLGFSADVFLGHFSDDKYADKQQSQAQYTKQAPKKTYTPTTSNPQQPTQEQQLKKIKSQIWTTAKQLNLTEQALADTSVELVNVPLQKLTIDLGNALLKELNSLLQSKQSGVVDAKQPTGKSDAPPIRALLWKTVERAGMNRAEFSIFCETQIGVTIDDMTLEHAQKAIDILNIEIAKKAGSSKS